MKYSDFRAFRKALDAGDVVEDVNTVNSSYMIPHGESGGYREKFFKYREIERSIVFPGKITLSEALDVKERYRDRLGELLGDNDFSVSARNIGMLSPFDEPTMCRFSAMTEEDV